jgi:hypothetical protein
MSIRFFRWTFVALMLSFWGTMILSGDRTIGASVEISNGNYRFVGGTRPRYVALALLMAVSYVALMNATVPVSTRPLPGVFRRFVAAQLDFMAITVLGSVVGILPVLAEWKRTGQFAWTFERNTPSSSDDFIAILGALLCFVLMFVYFLVPLIRRRPSPGACILGYQIIPDKGQSLTIENAAMRIILGSVALGSWPLTPFIHRERSRGKIWIDSVCNTRAVKL